jgi:tetratricopeptide (TPR) repeat protein
MSSSTHNSGPAVALEPAALPKSRGRWTALGVGSALVLLTLLSAAAILLITRPTSTVDQIVILTVPSGADIMFDSQQLGHSPVKLEGVRIGNHKLAITKDGFEPVEKDVYVGEARTIDVKLRPVPPPGTAGLPREDQIREYQRQAEEAFARGDYAIPYDGKSALYFADMVLTLDESNQTALDMREQVRKALHQSAQTAFNRGELGQAQEIYGVLVSNYPEDETARSGVAKVANLLMAHRRELVRKAEECLRLGKLIRPERDCAYYYAKEALSLDRQNMSARAVYNQVRDSLASEADEAVQRGDLDVATNRFEQVVRFFPEDKHAGERLKEVQDQRRQQVAQANDTARRREQGLSEYRTHRYSDAIQDLEFAVQHNRGSDEVYFGLGYSYLKTGQPDKAASFLSQVQASDDDTYRSSIAALGDASKAQGSATSALELYRKARDLGGSALYTIGMLDDRIRELDPQSNARAPEPSPLSIPVKHLHGGLLHSSCSGTLTVDATGIRYDSTDPDKHSFAMNFVRVGVHVIKDELTLQSPGKVYKFKAAQPVSAERFREAVSRYQNYASSR